MATKRLTSENAAIFRADEGTEVVGDGTDTLDELAGGLAASGDGAGYWLITAIDDVSSGFATNLEVGMVFYDAGTLVLEDGDKAKPLSKETMSDVQSFTFEFSVDEIETTTLADEYKVYNLGKTDMTGTIEGVFEKGTTDVAGGIMNKFVRVVRQAAAGTVTVTAVDDSPIFVMAFIDANTTAGETEGFFFAQVQLLGANLGASQSDKQSWSSSVRLAPGVYTPTLYFRELAS